MSFTIIRQDITTVKVDAIVNAADRSLSIGGGVSGAIFQAAGAKELEEASRPFAPIETGEAVLVPGFKLPAKYVIQTAGPIYRDHSMSENERLLTKAYESSLNLTIDHKLHSVAFPLISGGIYGYPIKEALAIAVATIKRFLEDHELKAVLVIFDKSFYSIDQDLVNDVDAYLESVYVDKDSKWLRFEAPYVQGYPEELAKQSIENSPLSDLVGNLDEPFSETILKLIDAKGLTDVEVYKHANLSRKLFSKIRSGHGYMPSKKTAIALAIGLKLNLAETDDLLERAGFTLSHAVKFDVIIEYFIVQKNYDVFEINQVLFQYDQPLL